MVFDAQDAITPVGKPVAVPIPVAPVVVCVKLVIATFKQAILEVTVLAVFSGVTFITPTASILPPPPVNRIL